MTLTNCFQGFVRAMVVFLSVGILFPVLLRAEDNPRPLKKNADVVLDATPFLVKPFEIKSVVDAIEGEPEKAGIPKAVVEFKINRVLKGDFTKVKTGGPSRFAQAQDAAQKHQFLKIATLDFSNPDREVEKEWMSIAVRDPMASFGISDWENPAKGRFKVYLKRLPDDPASYIMIGSQEK
ncbi:MAG: hypothetical protein PHN49_08855 [Candidatus Omnitrophica bacterium]|nr:hypothetical protein [Candidatus Omnitrophota bacterium]MDD5671734.1 hypothetical protein [Candidatus Omnitrophota bacterium]